MPDNIRAVEKNDLEDLRLVIDTSGLFPSALLDDMMNNYFDHSDTEEIWLTKLVDGKCVALSYCAPERLTQGTYNLYLIAVHKAYQGKGIGGELMDHIEKLLYLKGNRILLVETSGLPEYELTRKFYEKVNYRQEAVIRDFYRDGEDKVIFWKKLS